MALYNVKFVWNLNDTVDNPTDHVTVSVVDSTGRALASATINPAHQQNYWTLALPAGNGHVVTITAYNSINIPDPSPPQFTFNVVAATTPADPSIVSVSQVP